MKKPGLDDLSPRGTIRGAPYLLTGMALTALKVVIDSTVARVLFGRAWPLRAYVFPGELFAPDTLPPVERAFYLTMALVALPFVAVGVLLTVRRLRDARLPVWLAALFFLPLPLNLLFFLALAAFPSRPAPWSAVPPELPGDEPAPKKGDVLVIGPELGPPPGPVGALLPENDFLCAVVALMVSLPIGLTLGALSVQGFGSYGWGLFVGLPFAMPMVSVMIFGLRKPRTPNQCLSLGLSWLLLAFLVLLVFAFEGLICLVMVMPLAGPVVLLGSIAGYYAQRVPWAVRSPKALLLVLAALPTLIGAEGLAPRTPPLFPVTTAVVVDAPPGRVWRHVVSFHSLPPPDDWVFRTGVAYPVRATIEGTGPGAVRRCEFSTGAFVEPIEVWDEPRLLRFSVTANPPPMAEWNPVRDIHPPHLDGYLVSRRGQFRLVPLPGGRTRLEGTTWYHHSLWPAAYWRLWSDAIIHRIHARVLRHVQRLAESDTA